MTLSRRTLLSASGALAGAALAGPSPSRAAAPFVGRQAPNYYRLKLGAMELTMLSDGARAMPLGREFVHGLPNEAVLAAAEEAHMPKGSVVAPFNPMLVNTGAALVLIDTGYGPDTSPTTGLLPRTMAAAGIDPNSIDVVLISHLHGDHILGLRNRDGTLAFPNAEIRVPAVDFAYWTSDENEARLPPGYQKSTFGFVRRTFSGLGDRVTRYEWGREVAPGITAVETPGHTPGHTSFMIQSGGDSLFYQADVTNVPELFLRNPDWKVVFDSEPERAVATRRRVYDMCSADRLLVSGYHFPFPGLGYIEKAGTGYRLASAAWSPTL